MKKIIGLIIILIAFANCGTYKHIGTNISTQVRDSVVIRYDTIAFKIQNEKLQIVIDTLIKRDTIEIFNADSILSVKYWIDAYGQLQAVCEQRERLQKVPIQLKDNYKTITIEKDNVIIQEKKVTPFWIWGLVGIMGILILVLILRR